ncbi:MAG: hypothetical protein PUB97_08405 [Ruminococcus sp.]|nr:hypothetical protein [Ruminococcus sp.]
MQFTFTVQTDVKLGFELPKVPEEGNVLANSVPSLMSAITDDMHVMGNATEEEI